MKHAFKTTAFALLLSMGVVLHSVAQDSEPEPDKTGAVEAPPAELHSAKDYYNRGKARLAKSDLDGAIADFDRAIELDPKHSHAFYYRGFTKKVKGNLKGAIEDYTHAIELDPKYADAYANRGNVNQGMGDLDAANADLNKAIELNPKLLRAYVLRGDIKRANHDYDGAIEDFNSAIGLAPKDARNYNGRGFAKQAKGDLDGAIEDFNRAIELNPKLALAYNNRGKVKKSKGDLEGAVVDYSRAIELSPKYGNAYFNRANANSLLRNWKDALSDYQQVSFDRDFSQLMIWVLQARLGDKQAANRDLTAYLDKRLPPTSGDWIAKLGGYLLGSVKESDLFTPSVDRSRKLPVVLPVMQETEDEAEFFTANNVDNSAKQERGRNTEAWFFTGMKKLIAGDRQGATDRFNKCLADGRKSYISFELAGAELKAMGK